MIEFRNLNKNYGQVQALKDVTFNINDGEVFGLIGHNGAGKSTLIKILVSIIEQTSGEVYVDGKSLNESRMEIKPNISYVPDAPDVFPQLTTAEYWDLVRLAYNIDKDTAKSRLDYYADLFDMTGHLNQTLSSFSHGMKQKTILIANLMVSPKIWVLDEPMTGLDPQAMYDLKQIMMEHTRAGNIVLFSSHDLGMAESLCDRIVILKKGEVSYLGTVEELRRWNDDLSFEEIYLRMAGRRSEAQDNQNNYNGNNANGSGFKQNSDRN